MKIAVIGIGAMGSYYAAKLSRDNEVLAFEHFENKIEKVNKEGINLIEDDSTKNYKVKCFKDGEYNLPVNLILCCVKSTQTLNAIEQNKGLIDENTIVITMQNGLGNVKDISRYVDESNIVVGSSKLNLALQDENTVKVLGNGLTYVGSVTNDMKDVLIVKTVFDKAGFKCEATKDINNLVWDKLILNSVTNPLCALFKCKIRVIYENKNIWNIAEGLVEEACQVAKSANAVLNKDDVLEELRKKVYDMGQGYPSMYQDIKNNRITEIERLNGAIVNIAYKNKVNVPYNEFILNAIKAIEKLY
ncbi:MAG: 2-dehydropantoate 2-reductase [Acholeplasmatales bacterium]|nr:2-dehydropantoate 2-reductase [Acholeplasmatales bacterium]